MRLIVAGIRTDVGKSVVSAILTVDLGAEYWKSISSGRSGDREIVEEWIGRPALPEAYAFDEPVAGGIDGSFDPPQCSRLVIEMAGGVRVTLNLKVWPDGLTDYSLDKAVGGRQSLHYMDRLNVDIDWTIHNGVGNSL